MQGATPAAKPPRTRLSYIIKDPISNSSDSQVLHRQGVNSLVLDGSGETLYSAARDSIINSWNLQLDDLDFGVAKDGKPHPFSTIDTRQASSFDKGSDSVNSARAFSTTQRRRSDAPQTAFSLPSVFEGSSNQPVSPPHSPQATNGQLHGTAASLGSDARASKNMRVSFDHNAPRDHDNFRHLKHSSFSVGGYDRQVEYNKSILPPAKPAIWKRSFEWHGDWVNDITLCNNSRSLISCSSDRTICLWNVDQWTPPTRLGAHGDYVKRLAHPTMQNWVASGGLDRKIILWDLDETRSTEMQTIFSDEQPSASIYSLATNAAGSVIAAGTPEKFVRIFDPRIPNGNVQKLLGHTDTIRDLLVSEDGRWVLSASSDTTIKLWSLAMSNHCVTTYNHSEAPVWCLATSSPTFDTFWAGSKDGWVYKIACSQIEDDFRDLDCIAICRESEPVLKIAAIENAYLWTATTASSINRWPDVSFSPTRSLVVPDTCFCRRDSIEDTETESIYSKPTSLDNSHSEPLLAKLAATPDEGETSHMEVTPLWPEPNSTIRGVAGIRKSLLLNSKRHVVTLDTAKNVCVWDIISCSKVKDLGHVDFEKACESENTPEWVCNWCTIDTKHGDIMVHLDEGRCVDSEVYYQDLIPFGEPKNEDQRVNLAKWVLTYLLYHYMKSLYPDNPSFRDDHAAGETLQLHAIDTFSHGLHSEPFGLETPSMNVSLATPLVSFSPEPGARTPEPPATIDTTMGSQTPSTAVTFDPPTSPTTSVSPQPPEDDVGSPKSGKSSKNSFMTKFKTFRLRTPSSRSNEESPMSATTPNSALLPSAAQTATAKPALPDKDSIGIIDFEECPPVPLDPGISIVFSEESNSMFVDTFRSKIGELGQLRPPIHEMLPWVHDWIVAGNPPAKDLAKLSFVLIKHPKSSLSEIPQDINRLTANRMLRIRKVIQYLAEKINIHIDPKCVGSTASSNPADKAYYIELYCNGKALVMNTVEVLVDSKSAELAPRPSWSVKYQLLWSRIKIEFASFVSCFVGVSFLAFLHFEYSAFLYTSSSLETPDQHTALYTPISTPAFLVASFGASSILLYGAVGSPLAQPKNSILGQMVSAAAGVTVHQICDYAGIANILWLKSSLAVSCALLAMQLLDIVNPPGGATALLAAIGGDAVYKLGYWFVLMPVGVGIVILTAIAIFFHKVVFKRDYPYWCR
ncbi:hypothetical protein HDU91_005051 [Kappamyces sp. JEL0680]|nr:hypothetical protein HDU91_005051 [Kappamyces sp. JEL0680]